VGYHDLVKQVAESSGDADIVEGCLFTMLADIIKLEFLNQPHDPVKAENDFLQLLRRTFYKIGMSEQDAAAMAEIDRRIIDRLNPPALAIGLAMSPGHLLPWSAPGHSQRQVARQQDPAAARLQPAVFGRGLGQSGRRLLPVLAWVRLPAALGHQLPGWGLHLLLRRAGGRRRRSGFAPACPLARFITKSPLASLLLVTAARLIDWHRPFYALRASRYDAGLVMATAFAAVFISVAFSILIGVALSIFL